MSDDFEPAESADDLAMREAEADARRQSARKPRPTPKGLDRTAGRDMPASEEAEQHVIACCLLDGSETIARCLEARLSSDSFFWPTNQILFQLIVELYQGGQSVTLEVLAEELSTRRLLDKVGGISYLVQVTDKVPTTAHAQYMIHKVRECSILRASIKAHTLAVEEAYQFTGNIDEYLRLTQARTEAITRQTAEATQAQKLATLNSRRVKASTPLKEPPPRLSLAGKPIATPGNIQTLISRAKTGKTAALGAATAAIIDAASGTSALAHDTFKFTAAANPDKHAVIVIDTEQSPFDAYQCYLRALARAGQANDPEWLHHYSLVGQGPGELRASLDLAIQQAGKIHTIILDGVADFVSSVNDEAECNAFVNWVRERAVNHDCPIICVIHSNEAEKSGDDGRGHLGKQLIRKAESNLLLKKTSEVTTITSDKQRKAPITAADKVAFRWSDERQMHVSCDPESGSTRSKSGRPQTYTLEQFERFMPESEATALPQQQIFRRVSQHSPITAPGFKNLIFRLADDGEICRIDKPNIGACFYLKPRV